MTRGSSMSTTIRIGPRQSGVSAVKTFLMKQVHEALAPSLTPAGAFHFLPCDS